MFDFQKRDPARGDESPVRDQPAAETGSGASQPAAARRPAGGHEAAIIGPSIHIEGDLHGEEDLIIEGEVKGAVHLRHHSLTIGSKGKVTADVYANVINVDGYMHGDLYGAERVSVRRTAQVQGNITSPRVSLDDGARFKGSIEMDPESETLKKAFGERRDTTRPAAPPPPKPATATPAASVPPGKPDMGSAAAAVRGGKVG